MQNQIEGGVISKVAGEEMSAAMRSLPSAGPLQTELITCDINTLLVGHVRITFECQRYRYGRNTFWHWCGKRAIQLEQPAG
ncbi:hypothetical protein ACF8OH_27335 [Delftia sp. WSY_9]|uniref:hypothetical protein n=1 Tax=Delftia acidovorans TaxID=80866 RepID=UPI0032E00DF4